MEDDEILKELEKEYQEEDDVALEKEINQLEKVMPATKALADMGAFYKAITTTLTKDMICYICKNEIGDKEPFDIVQVPEKNVVKGLVVFSSVCKNCNKPEVKQNE